MLPIRNRPFLNAEGMPSRSVKILCFNSGLRRYILPTLSQTAGASVARGQSRTDSDTALDNLPLKVDGLFGCLRSGVRASEIVDRNFTLYF